MFYRLMAAHLAADFVFQTRWLVQRKHTPTGMALHIVILGLAIAAVAADRLATWWPWLLAVVAAHAAIDWAKVRLQPRLRLPPILPFLADQAAHILSIVAVIALAELNGLRVGEAEPVWWLVCAYLAATFGLSIALPLWLDPYSLMERPATARLTLIAVSALVLTLAWRGWPILIPVVGLGLYGGVARPLARSPAAATFAIEFWSAIAVAASLGWGLA
jgi:hypothetical protein